MLFFWSCPMEGRGIAGGATWSDASGGSPLGRMVSTPTFRPGCKVGCQQEMVSTPTVDKDREEREQGLRTLKHTGELLCPFSAV